MKKVHLLFALIVIPLLSNAQDIKVNEIDNFTKQHRVRTKQIVLRNKLSCGINLTFRSVDSTMFIIMDGYGCAVGVVGEGDKALILLQNESVITVYSTGIQSYKIGRPNDYYSHQYSISKEDALTLGQQPIKSIRRHYNSNYQDIDIAESNSKKVMSVANSFLKAIFSK